MAVVFEKPKSMADVTLHYCPGCTHGIIQIGRASCRERVSA